MQRRTPQEITPGRAISLDCNAFRRNPDGSWTTVAQTRVLNPAGFEISLTSNMTFPKGKGLNMMGFDLTEYLEEHCK